jgi:FAD/FMN-containing dehydrogenase
MQIENDCDRELDNIDSAVSRSCPAFSQVSKCLSFSDIIPTRGGHAGPRSDTSCLGSHDMTDVWPMSSAQLGPGGHWRNWVGNQSFVARHKAEPSSEDELAALVHEASRQGFRIRVAGSGHSFTPVVATSGLLLSLRAMQGLVSADLDRKRVVVRAGTKIGDIGRALKRIGLSLANQGDIDTQAIAGALSTGTHGTGIGLGCLSSQAVGIRLIQSDGSVVEIDGDRDTETMAAAQVSIGMLGVISTITLQAISAYNLKETLWRDTFESCMERHDELAANNRHFSFFWCPTVESRHLYCLPDVTDVSKVKREQDVCEMKVMNVTDEEPYSNDKNFERVAYSSDIYPIEYIPNFHELEYAIPVETGKEALRQIRELMLTKHTNCIYPVEYRFVGGDSGMLSPYYERASVTISVSGGPGIDYWSYLVDVDTILRRYGARPHWGKLHFNCAEDMPLLYPRFHDFQSIRRKMDPSGCFLNDHLRNLFE